MMNSSILQKLQINVSPKKSFRNSIENQKLSWTPNDLRSPDCHARSPVSRLHLNQIFNSLKDIYERNYYTDFDSKKI